MCLVRQRLTITFKYYNKIQCLKFIITNSELGNIWLTEHNSEIIEKTRIMQFRPHQKEKLDLKLVTMRINIKEESKGHNAKFEPANFDVTTG